MKISFKDIFSIFHRCNMDNLLYWKTVACIVKLLKEGGEGEGKGEWDKRNTQFSLFPLFYLVATTDPPTLGSVVLRVIHQYR